jgi:ABC-type lipoprotein export system ATPase subunit
MNNQPNNAVIVLRGVHKGYSFGSGHYVSVLRGLDLRVGQGEILAIRGVSGSGKSTLLHLMGGLDRPDRGEVLCGGEPMADWDAGRLARWRGRQVGFIFQASQLLPELTVLENIALPGWLAREDVRARARELAVLTGLEARLHHRPGELSGGEQQRVAIARALVRDPSLLLADEPTGNLDSGNRDAVLHLLLDLSRQRTKALVLVTHDDAVAAQAGRVLELADGRLHERPL